MATNILNWADKYLVYNYWFYDLLICGHFGINKLLGVYSIINNCFMNKLMIGGTKLIPLILNYGINIK